MATILCIGSELMSGRQLVLHSAGFKVVIATNEVASLAVYRATTVDAVILDSRVCTSEVSHFASTLKNIQPVVPIVLITDSGTDNLLQGRASYDRILSRLDGPVVLLETLRQLISRGVAVSDATKQTAAETRSSAHELRSRIKTLRDSLSKTRQLSKELSKHPKRD